MFSEEIRQGVIDELTHGVVVVNAALFLIEYIVVRGKDLTAEHFICHINRLALDLILCADGVIDEVTAAVEVVVLHQRFDEIHVILDTEVAVGAVVPARAAYRQEVADIVIIIAELQPSRDRAE